MITRVADQMKYDLLYSSISNIQNQNNDLMTKLSSGKEVNEPSDNPLGMGQILDYRSALAQISTYKNNIDSSNAWLSTTESSLSSVNDILTQVKETAVSQASATATASTRQTAADSLQPLIDQILSLANTKVGNSYIFSGTRTDTEPFSATSSAAHIGPAVKAIGDAFDGSVSSGGTYTAGTSNKTYVVKIVSGGAIGAATYEVSEDGGRTWLAGGPQATGATINVGTEGVQLNFTAGTKDFAANDVFTVNAYAQGYYNGNGEELSSEVGSGVNMAYNVTGEAAFTSQGQGTVDIFQRLNDLKTALQNNDTAGINSQLDYLTQASNQITRYTALCGTRENGLNTSSSTLDDMNTRITGLNSNVEDADMAKLITDYQTQQVALQAAYQMAATLTSNSILNFIR